jgi:hypothetical protein
MYAWDPALRQRAGQALRDALQRQPEATQTIAESLAPELKSAAGIRVNVYRDTLSPAQRARFQDAFPTLAAFFDTLSVGEPGAIEVGLEILHRIHPRRAVDIAELLLTEPPWLMLSQAIGHALGASDEERAFALLLAHADQGYLYVGLRDVGYPDGAARARAAAEALGDLMAPDVDSGDRAIGEALLSYRVRFDRDAALAELAAHLATPGSRLRGFAAHTLTGPHGTEATRDLVIDVLARGEHVGTVATVAARTRLNRDATSMIDAMGGVEHLVSEEAEALTGLLLDMVARDAREATVGRTSQGWLHADARWGELAERVRKRKPFKDVAAWVLAQLPARPRPQTARPRAPKPTTKLAPALARQMQDTRAAIERLVAHLRRDGYRFLAPRRAHRPPTKKAERALAKLEAELGPVPPVLRAWWQIVGSVDLRGEDPSWPERAHTEAIAEAPAATRDVWRTDPLVILPPDHLLDDALDDAVPDAPNALVFAPDAYGKAGYSGGTLAVWLPAEADDPVIEGGPRGETLRAHLQRALAWGGMPGLADIPDAPADWLAAARAATTGP